MIEISDPVVWRQLLVPPTITSNELSKLMIASFGWANCHLHMWAVRKVTQIAGYATPLISELNPEGFEAPDAAISHENVAKPVGEGGSDDEYDFDFDEESDGLTEEITLRELDDQYNLTGNDHLLHYEYDMGDGWEHILMVEKRIPEAEVLNSDIMKKRIGGPVQGKNRTSAGVEKGCFPGDAGPMVTGGFGHAVAEDAGSYPGWEFCKEAYQAKGTKRIMGNTSIGGIGTRICALMVILKVLRERRDWNTSMLMRRMRRTMIW